MSGYEPEPQEPAAPKPGEPNVGGVKPSEFGPGSPDGPGGEPFSSPDEEVADAEEVGDTFGPGLSDGGTGEA